LGDGYRDIRQVPVEDSRKNERGVDDFMGNAFAIRGMIRPETGYFDGLPGLAMNGDCVAPGSIQGVDKVAFLIHEHEIEACPPRKQAHVTPTGSSRAEQHNLALTQSSCLHRW